MSAITTTAVVAASIGAGGAVASGLIGAHASGKAADKIAAGQDTAAQLAQDNLAKVTDLTNTAVDQGQQKIDLANQGLSDSGKQISALYDPFTQGESGTVQQLQDIASPTGDLSKQFSFTGADLVNDPGYQETLTRGQDAIQRSAAAQGGVYGTNTLKRLADWTVGTANQNFNDAFQRAQSTFTTNRQSALSRADTLKSLASLALSGTSGKANTQGQVTRDINQNILTSADMGIRGAGVIANASTGASNSEAAAATGAANAQAAGTVGSTNSWLNALKQGTAGIQDFLAQRSASGSSGFTPTVGPYQTSADAAAAGGAV